MTRGFFAGSQLVSKPRESTLPRCGICKLNKHCKSPKLGVIGEGAAKILIVGECPSRFEDAGSNLLGDPSKYLRKTLREFGLDLYSDCWKTNAVICRPEAGKVPTDKEVEYCRPNLLRIINELKPNVILLLGTLAVRSLIGHIWRDAPGSISRWQGYTIPCQKINSWICPTFHPSYCLREGNKVIDSMFRNAIENVVDRSDHKPFKKEVNEKSEIDLIYDVTDAARIIRKMIQRGGPVAFDYETNKLKPDGANACIVSCSISWRGKKTIAYPWHGEAIKATRELLRSDLPKIASNLKFEQRWSRSILKTRVRNWIWDTMVCAHVLDNRPSSTSIKFQSFVLLGSDVWDDHIQQFLHTKGKDTDVNQILEQITLKDLLVYNGLDSLLEYRVAAKQMKLMKHKLFERM